MFFRTRGQGVTTAPKPTTFPVPKRDVHTATTTYVRSFNPYIFKYPALIGLAATSAAVAASWYHTHTKQSILEQVVVDKKGNLYLAAAQEELFYDPESQRVLSYYEYIISLMKEDDIHPSKMSYLILFPVIEDAEGELMIDYEHPACASQTNAYKHYKINHLTSLATREDLEGLGLGKVVLVNEAERAIKKCRSINHGRHHLVKYAIRSR